MRQSPYHPKGKKTFLTLLLPGLWRVAVFYLVIAAVMFSMQRSMMYLPDEVLPSPQEAGVEMEAISLTTPDKIQLTAWYGEAQPGFPTILYLQGNAGSLATRDAEFRSFLGAGFGVLAVSYRGFAGSHGHPTEQGLYTDARTAMRWLKDKNIHAKQVILYGESLGTGVAAQMALEYNAKAVVLEAPYISIPAAASGTYWYLPVEQLVLDRFDTLEKIGFIASPLLVIHGQKDEKVPFSHGQRVFDAAPEPKKFLSFEENGHNNSNVDDITRAIGEFVGVAIHDLPPPVVKKEKEEKSEEKTSEEKPVDAAPVATPAPQEKAVEPEKPAEKVVEEKAPVPAPKPVKEAKPQKQEAVEESAPSEPQESQPENPVNMDLPSHIE